MPEILATIVKQAPWFAMKSDIIRLWLVCHFGGIYLDTDIYPLRNFDELLVYDHFLAVHLGGRSVSNAVFGATPGHYALAHALSMIVENFRLNGISARRTEFGPALFNSIERRKPGYFRKLPKHYFYILNRQESALRFRAKTSKEQAADLKKLTSRMTDDVEPFAIHTWGIPPSEMPAGFGRSSFAVESRERIVVQRTRAS